MFFRRRKKYSLQELSPDEIFMDSANIPGFEQGRMEGRLELPLSRRSVSVFFAAFAGVAIIFAAQLFRLQVIEAEKFGSRANSNRLEIHSILPERGLILDRFGKKLAWNDPSFQLVLNASSFGKNINIETLNGILSFLGVGMKEGDLAEYASALSNRFEDIVIADLLDWKEVEAVLENFPEASLRAQASSVRRYVSNPGLAHLLGFLGYPDRVEEDIFSAAGVKSGKSGIELLYNRELSGSMGKHSVEVDSKGRVVAEATQEGAKNGSALNLTIDSDLQLKLFEGIAAVVRERGFRGGAGVILDLDSGEILAITSFPEFDSNLFTLGISVKDLAEISSDSANPFFFRATSGLYQPGSIIKPLIALAALNEGTVSPEKEVYSSGSISVANPYFPDKPSIFHDWKAHGWVDMRRALAVSSNVYFYAIGGGYGDVAGLGAVKLEDYFRLFGFDQAIDFVLPNAENSILGLNWKKEENPEDPIWRVGDTYNLSIGQSMLASPLQIIKFAATLALDGRVPKLKVVSDDSNKLELEMAMDIPKEYFLIVKEGMRQAVLTGTAQALAGLGVSVAGKTGTAEIGNSRVHSWFAGFMPYEHPKTAIVVVLENGDSQNLVGAASASRGVVGWMVANRPEYVNNSLDVSP